MRGLRKTAAGVAAVALAAGVIAGCGGSSDTASTAAAESAATSTTAELTQAEYVAEANALCRKIDELTRTLGENADTETLKLCNRTRLRGLRAAAEFRADEERARMRAEAERERREESRARAAEERARMRAEAERERREELRARADEERARKAELELELLRRHLAELQRERSR